MSQYIVWDVSPEIFHIGSWPVRWYGTLIPPVGLLAAYAYYRQGDIDIRAALWIATGFLIGGFFGAKFATMLPTVVLSKVFAGILLVIAVKMWFTTP